MHSPSHGVETLAALVTDFAVERLSGSRRRLPAEAAAEPELARALGGSITEEGLGAPRALEIFKREVLPTCVAVDDPRYLAFMPSAPTPESVLFDLVVSASGAIGSTWVQSSGCVHAENEVLSWLARRAGFPSGSGGTFVSGGTLGTLACLAAAREAKGNGRERPTVAVSEDGHASVDLATRLLGLRLHRIGVDERGRLDLPGLDRAIESLGQDLIAVVANAGTTNLGAVDDLAEIGRRCRSQGVWLHVDGAYGLAALASERHRRLFEGIELADSFIVDPHKWLFAPYDSCAVVYREPARASALFRQSASYLDPLNTGQPNPQDLAVHLTRRPRGLPLWFSLVARGERAYAEAIDKCVATARAAAAEIDRTPGLELVAEPVLSIVAFRRPGWTLSDYSAWAAELQRNDLAFVRPTVFRGEACMRFAFLNPSTSLNDITPVLENLSNASAT